MLTFFFAPKPKGASLTYSGGSEFPSILPLSFCSHVMIIDHLSSMSDIFLLSQFQMNVRLFEMSCSSSGSDFQTFSPPTRLKLRAGVLIVPGLDQSNLN